MKNIKENRKQKTENTRVNRKRKRKHDAVSVGTCCNRSFRLKENNAQPTGDALCVQTIHAHMAPVRDGRCGICLHKPATPFDINPLSKYAGHRGLFRKSPVALLISTISRATWHSALASTNPHQWLANQDHHCCPHCCPNPRKCRSKCHRR